MSNLREARKVLAMRGAFKSVRKRQQDSGDRIRDLEGRKARLRETRERSVGNQALLDEAKERLRENGIKVHLARTRDEAISLVQREIEGEKLVVKSKSNATKEIGLTEALESAGIEVVETDIGDRIVQLAHEKPSHPTGPASHLSRHEIARVLSAHLGRKVEPDPETIARLVKEEIAGCIDRAGVGITGANALTAEEGSIVLQHNEGNILKVMMRPRKHLVIAGIDKIYPDLEEAIIMAKLQAFYATGSVASYLHVITGPSKTGDVEKVLVQGVHGPQEVCLILLDNHRSDIAGSEFKELLYCIGCGECLLVCPAYNVYGKRFAHGVDLGGKGVAYSALSQGTPDGETKGLDLCLNCGKCRDACPVSLDVPAMIRKLRTEYQERVLPPRLAAISDFLDSHLRWLLSAAELEVLGLISRVIRLQAERDASEGP
ncbi:MAG: LUD domain-containing protein [Dehalococcoidia bacterium]